MEFISAVHPKVEIILGIDSFFFFKVILIDMLQYLIVVFFYIFLMTNYVEHLFMCILTICISSSVECLFKSFAPPLFKNWVASFLMVEF